MRAAKRTQKGVGHPDRDTRIEAARCRKCAQRIRGAGIGSAPPVLGEVPGVAQSEIEALAGNRMQRLSGVADVGLARRDPRCQPIMISETVSGDL